jgi:hypothetical protein
LILVTLHISKQPALFVLLGADGSINRMGDGSVDNSDRDLYIGITSTHLFEAVRQQVGPELLKWIGGYGDPSPRGETCDLSVHLAYADGSEEASEWHYGSESIGPPQVIRDFVIAAVEATEPWFQEQRRNRSREQ